MLSLEVPVSPRDVLVRGELGGPGQHHRAETKKRGISHIHDISESPTTAFLEKYEMKVLLPAPVIPITAITVSSGLPGQYHFPAKDDWDRSTLTQHEVPAPRQGAFPFQTA